MYMGVEPKIGGFFLGTPNPIHLFIGFGTIIFTIHFGGSGPYFWKHPNRTVDGSLKSGVHQLRLVGSLSTIIFGFQHHPRWLFGISAINSSIQEMLKKTNETSIIEMIRWIDS